MKVLAIGDDDLIKEWVYHSFGVYCTQVNLSAAIIEDEKIVGAVFFHAHNGPDVELSYYGPNTLTLGILKKICKIAVDHMGVSRITVRTSKSNKIMNKGIHKLGWVYEGIRHHAYGDQDAVMYGLFGEKLARLAGKAMQ